MNDVKTYLYERYNEFWLDIYGIEKDEVKALKDYIDYVKININFSYLSADYKSTVDLFMKKHLDYLDEAFSSLIIGNYNAFSCVGRIIIENYVSLFLIINYKKEGIWLDWYLWGNYKLIDSIEKPYNKQIKKAYETMCKHFDVPSDYIKNKQTYGWLGRVYKCRFYSFKIVCNLVDKSIYEDFSYLSMKIHNTD